MAILSYLIKYSRLAWGLRGFLRNTITLEDSKRIIIERLRNRENNFLNLVQKGIYQDPDSPFSKLLQVAGCEYGDIELLVSQEGVEGALKKLLSKGVYISWEEFKGRKEVVRGSRRFQFKDSDFDNPFLNNYYQTQSSGSRSAGTRTTFDFSRMSANSHYFLPMLVANNAQDMPIGVWKSIFPGVSGTIAVLSLWKVGHPAARWFSPVNEKQVQSSLQHRLATKYIRYGGILWGATLPKPEHVPLEEAVRVAHWMAETKKEFGGCSLICSPNSAVRLCHAALQNGMDIMGTRFLVSGEPLTEAKRQQIKATGALVTPRYIISEVGPIGCGCTRGSSVDDMHLLHDSIAVVQHPRRIEHTDIEVDTFLYTPLLPTAPRIMLNMESDDYGLMETRSCDCLFCQLGLNRHIHSIRSFAKLTGSGMTIVGTDLVRILEEVLPGKYGGVAADYQILEEEDSQGETHLSLIISPSVGVIDEDGIIATMLGEVRRSAHGGKLAAGFWSQINTMQIKRMNPISKMGKVTTLHLMKRE